MSRSNRSLTTPDLVVLSLLSEAPMHGYQVVRELDRRDVRDWAGVSRPQVYYSLKKLRARRLIAPVRDANGSAGPERTVFAATAAARRALSDALDRPEWMNQRPPPPFVTWLCLSLYAPPRVVVRGLAHRRRFLQQELARETRTLAAIRADTGPSIPLAAAVVEHTIATFRLELKWLERVSALTRGG